MLFWLIAVITLGLDRLTKYWVTTRMSSGQTIPIIKDFFHLTFLENPGAAFGMLANRTWFFILITVFVLGCIVYLVYTTAQNNTWMLLALGLVSGGALGNLLDRIQTGLVIDFLDFRGIWSYIFNVADMGVVVGVIILAWRIILVEK